MSLRGFHIVFVTIVTLLFAFMAFWAFVLAEEPSRFSTVIGWIGIAGVIGMPVYGVYFYRKSLRMAL